MSLGREPLVMHFCIFNFHNSYIVDSKFQALEEKGNYYCWSTLMSDQKKRISFKHQSTKGFPRGKQNYGQWKG